MRTSNLIPIISFLFLWPPSVLGQFFDPHADLNPKDWNNIFEEMQKEREEEEYEVQEQRFEIKEAAVREVLGNLNRLSEEAVAIAELATEEIQLQTLRDFNTRMLREHRIILFNIADIGDQLEIPVLNGLDRGPALNRLRELDGMEFEKQYRETIRSLHSEIKNYLNRPSVRAISWPLVREALNNIENKIFKLLRLASSMGTT